MKEQNKIIIGGILILTLIVAIFWLQRENEEFEQMKDVSEGKEQTIEEESENQEVEVDQDDPITKVIQDEPSEQIKTINDCLGSSLYSLNPAEIVENLTEGKYSEKDILLIGKNYHGLNKENEKYMFSYKRLEFEDKGIYDLKVVKELPDGAVQSISYEGDQELDSVKSNFGIQRIILKEETKAFSEDGISLYLTSSENDIKELTLSIKDKVVSCEDNVCNCR